MRILVGRNHPLAAASGEKGTARSPELEITAFPESELYLKAVELRPDAIVVGPGADRRSPPDSPSVVPALALGAGSLVLCSHGVKDSGAYSSIGPACAYFLTTAEVQEIVRIIEEHEKHCPRSAAQFDSDALLASGARAEHLTPREVEILTLIAQERTSKEIARRLGISPRTVSAHRFSLMKKLHIHSTTGLVLYALRTGIAEK